MNLADLKSLLAVVEHGSFQAAAHALEVPRTKLRRQVDRFERTVGTQLLHRGAGGVRLTIAGERVVRRAGPLLSQANRMLAEARTADGAGLMRLRVIVPVGTPSEPRVRALLTLQELHPNLALDVVEADDPLSLLRSPFDIMLHLGESPARQGYFSRVLMDIPLRLAASPSYLQQYGTPGTPQDLAGHRLLTWRAAKRYAKTWPLSDGTTLPITPTLTSANSQLLASVAEQDGGIALLPGPRELFFPSVGSLVPVLESQVGTQLPLRTLSQLPSRVDPRLRALIENAQRMLASLAID